MLFIPDTTQFARRRHEHVPRTPTGPLLRFTSRGSWAPRFGRGETLVFSVNRTEKRVCLFSSRRAYFSCISIGIPYISRRIKLLYQIPSPRGSSRVEFVKFYPALFFNIINASININTLKLCRFHTELPYRRR